MAKKRKSRKQAEKEKEELRLSQEEMATPARKDGAYLICGLVCLAIAVYTLIALFSYVFTWAPDQSAIRSNDVLNSIIEVENGGGKMGLVWANFLVSKLFGLGAFIIPFFFLGVALFCLKIRRVRLIRLFFITVIGCILLSVLFSFIFSFTNVDRLFGTSAGGSYGYYINQWLKSMIGVPGTAAMLVITIIGWLILINKSLIKKIGDGISTVGTKVMDGISSKSSDNQEVEESSQKEEEAVHADGEREDSAEEADEGAEVEQYEEVDEDIEEYEEGVEDEENTDPANSFAAGTDAASAIKTADTDEVKFEVINHTEQETSAEGLIGEYTEEELQSTFDPRLELSYYKAPTLDLLETYKDKWYKVSAEELERNKNKIVNTLANYKIKIDKVSARIGPTVTLYEVVPAPGVRVSQIKRLEEDIQLSLAARGVRVVTLPGTNAIGIEVANEKPSVVSMLSCLEYLQGKIKEPGSKEAGYELPVAMGKTIANEVFTFDLAKAPHLLIAGATGQGKSVGLNALLTSILYTKHPSEVKFVLVDPKKVELTLYSKLRKHFLACLPECDEKPVITDKEKVVTTLRSLCVEMDERYRLLESAAVRNIREYNEKFLSRKLNPAKGHKYLPYIVAVIDEYGDLIITAGKKVELPLTRLAQLARAVGIHLVIATQRPTTTVITGNIKANFPARIAFYVRSSIDSRTILDESGANQLVGRGDMLYSTGVELTRIQCALVDTKEVNRLVEYISEQQGYGSPMFLPEVKEDEDGADVAAASQIGETDLRRRDAMFDDAARLIVAAGSGSASFLQRKIGLGYNRASRVIDQLEKAGIIGSADGSKPRASLVPDLITLEEKLEEIKQQYGV